MARSFDSALRASLRVTISSGSAAFPQQPIRNINLGLEVFRGGMALHEVGDGHVEVRDGLELLRPLGEAIDIGKGSDLPGAQDGELLRLKL